MLRRSPSPPEAVKPPPPPERSGTPSAQQHRMDRQSTLVNLAEIEAAPGNRRELLAREEIELAEHRRRSCVQRAAEWGAICLVRMPGEDPDDPILVARHHRFQGCRLTHNKRRAVVRRACQATGVMDDNQVSQRRRRCQFIS